MLPFHMYFFPYITCSPLHKLCLIEILYIFLFSSSHNATQNSANITRPLALTRGYAFHYPLVLGTGVANSTRILMNVRVRGGGGSGTLVGRASRPAMNANKELFKNLHRNPLESLQTERSEWSPTSSFSRTHARTHTFSFLSRRLL